MCQGEVDIPTIEDRYDIDFKRYFSDALPCLEPLAGDGLVSVSPRRISVSLRGRMLLRIIAMCFDRYLQTPAPVNFSKAI